MILQQKAVVFVVCLIPNGSKGSHLYFVYCKCKTDIAVHFAMIKQAH